MKKFIVLLSAGLLILAFAATGFAQDKLDFRVSGMVDIQSHNTVNVPGLNASATPIFNSANGFYTLAWPLNAAGSAVPPGNLTQAAINQVYSIYGVPIGTPLNNLNRRVSYWDSRMHLKFDMVMGKELSGTLMLEIDANRYGGSQNGPLGNSTQGGGLFYGQIPGAQFREGNNVGYWSTDRTALEVKYMYFDVALPYLGIPVPMTVRLGAQPLAIRPGFFVATDGTGISGGIKMIPS